MQLNSRFSLPPNSLGYCGKESAVEKFKGCVVEGSCKGIQEEVKKFIVLNPYLKTLSKITDLPKFSYKVIESYWLGNDLLKKAKNSDYLLLLENFKKQGVPEWLICELQEKKPKRFIPTHLFQVLHVGVGKASGSVPYNIETINNCMIRWGKVTKVIRGKVTVELNSLIKTKGHYVLTVLKETHPVLPGFILGLKVGDTVVIHWNQVIKRLTVDEIEKISFWTKAVLKTIDAG